MRKGGNVREERGKGKKEEKRREGEEMKGKCREGMIIGGRNK